MLLCSLTMGCVLLCSALFSSFRLFSSPSFLPSFLLSFLPSFPLPLFPSLAASLPRSQVLFNPWDERDATYMDTSTGRKEYVERTKGGIWQSRESAPGKDDDGFVVWGFDQNTKIVLDVALSLLTKSREGKKPEHVLTSGQRGSPTDVSRWLSFAINEFVLKGKWSKPYDAPPNTSRGRGSDRARSSTSTSTGKRSSRCGGGNAGCSRASTRPSPAPSAFRHGRSPTSTAPTTASRSTPSVTSTSASSRKLAPCVFVCLCVLFLCCTVVCCASYLGSTLYQLVNVITYHLSPSSSSPSLTHHHDGHPSFSSVNSSLPLLVLAHLRSPRPSMPSPSPDSQLQKPRRLD